VKLEPSGHIGGVSDSRKIKLLVFGMNHHAESELTAVEIDAELAKTRTVSTL